MAKKTLARKSAPRQQISKLKPATAPSADSNKRNVTLTAEGFEVLAKFYVGVERMVNETRVPLSKIKLGSQRSIYNTPNPTSALSCLWLTDNMESYFREIGFIVDSGKEKH